MASADVNSSMLPPSLSSSSSSSSPWRMARSAAAAAPRDSGHCRGDPRREEGGRSALLGACEKLIILLYSPGDLRAAKAVQESVPAIPSKSPSPEHHRSRLEPAGPPALPVPLIPRGDVTGSQCGQRWLLRVASGGGRGHDADGSSWAQHLINRLNYPRFAIKLQGGSGGTVGADGQEGGL